MTLVSLGEGSEFKQHWFHWGRGLRLNDIGFIGGGV